MQNTDADIGTTSGSLFMKIFGRQQRGNRHAGRRTSNERGRNSQPLIWWMRETSLFVRTAGTLTIAVFLNACLFPYMLMAQEAIDQNEASEAIELVGTVEEQLNQALLKVQGVVEGKQLTIAERLANEGGLLEDILAIVGLDSLEMEEMDSLEQLNTLMADLHVAAMSDFDAIDASLLEDNMPDIILQRHQDAVSQYQQQFDLMIEKINGVFDSGNLAEQGEAIDQLNELMAPQKLKKGHEFSDPNNLPWGAPDASKTREPAQTAAALSALTGISPWAQGTQVASNIITPEMLGQLGGPVAEDLAETIDLKFTDAIKAKALELDEDPVKIYNWVRNNIEFIPSYGSIQGADYTLQHGKGNAFDTASLLIALFRVANIPARYAYGTVEIPAAKVMNWVGGVEVPEAAMELLGQGGIPTTGLISGGQIEYIQIEHVWVETWVDYEPSRAANHVIGDSWIPLDPSFKQYDYSQGQDLETNVPFDAQVLVDQISQTAAVNETEGWVQNVDQTQIEIALNDYQQQIEDYINNQNPDATLGDVLGTQKVILQAHQQLATGLPYDLLVRTHNYSSLPDELRHKFRYTLGTELYGIENIRLITFEQSLPEIAGQKLALSFKPATQADEDLIASYLPAPDPDTGEIDPAQIPDTLPGYLIGLTAEFTQEGAVIHSAEAGNMGGELYETLGLWSPAFGWDQAVNHPIAGEYRAIGLDLQGANPEEAQRLQTQVENTKAILESGDEGQLVTLTKNELVGDLFYATIYSYLALNDIQYQIQAKAAGVVNYRLPSFGLFGSVVVPSYWFGIPRNVSFGGLAMDVDRMATQVTDKTNEAQRTIGFVQSMGLRSSALEHLVPEQMFSTEDAPVQGISAVKALAIAGAEGQKIWTIDENNLEIALAAINLAPETEAEIRDAVNTGIIATAHESQIDFNSWVGEGYLLIDPETGAGAYKISGGGNGGVLIAIGALMVVLAFVAVGLSLFSTVATGGALGPAAIALIAPIIAQVSAGLALVARGYELIAENAENAAVACDWALRFISSSLTGFLFYANEFLGLFMGVTGSLGLGSFSGCIEFPE